MDEHRGSSLDLRCLWRAVCQSASAPHPPGRPARVVEGMAVADRRAGLRGAGARTIGLPLLGLRFSRTGPLSLPDLADAVLLLAAGRRDRSAPSSPRRGGCSLRRPAPGLLSYGARVPFLRVRS